MMYIATFYSHFGAIRFKKICEKKGWQAKIMPVPRDLSSSCGTCVRYETMEEEFSLPISVPEEVEKIVSVDSRGYTVVFQAENS